MRALAFSLAVAVLVAHCHGGVVPNSDSNSGNGGTGPDMNPCGPSAIPFPGWTADSCAPVNCPAPGSCKNSVCCIDRGVLAGICDSGYPQVVVGTCDANNCEGTCSSMSVGTVNIPICCTAQQPMGGECPTGMAFAGPDCSKCDGGQCISSERGDGTSREFCCVNEGDLPNLPDSNAHCKAVDPPCQANNDCAEAHACREGKCCPLMMEVDEELKKCSSTGDIIQEAIAKGADCLLSFGTIITATSHQQFCSIFWTGLECLVGKFFPETDSQQEKCLGSMRRLVKSDPKGILKEVEKLLESFGMPQDFSKIENYDASTCPGIYDCEYEGTTYQSGDKFPDKDVCNTCFCDNKMVGCTEMACLPTGNKNCMWEGRTIMSGTSFLHKDQCNTCYCKDERVKCTDLVKCKKGGGGKRCPVLPENSFGNCDAMECGEEKPCESGYICCSDGCGRVCKPDMSICDNVESMIQFSDKAPDCQQRFVVIAENQQNLEEFCNSFWGGVECLAKDLTKSNKMFEEQCMKRMAHQVMSNSEVLDKIMERVAMGENVPDISHNPAECPVVKEREDTDMSMDDGERRDQPEYDKDVAMKCGNLEMVKMKAKECKQEHDAISAASGHEKKCKALEKFLHCVVGKFFNSNQREEMKICLGDLQLFFEKHRERIANMAEFRALTNIRVHECLERKQVCGEGMMPMADRMCGGNNGQCPSGYECRQQFCCPAEREGKCPMTNPNAVLNCDEECMKDDDCDEDYKCCHQKSCGHKICIRLEAKELSTCQKDFENAVKHLERTGICGDGKTSVEIPRCQGTGYAPVQGDFRMGHHCARPDGTKIPGSDFTGNRDCTKVREGECSSAPAQCLGENANVVDICTDDDDCNDEEHKCCITRESDGTCVRQCIARQTVAADKEVSIPECPNNEERSCCPVTMCLGMKCLAHKGAVCRINSCGGCSVEFYNKEGMKVNCSEGISMCQHKQAMAMAKNMRAKSDMEKMILFIKGLKERHGEEKEKEHDEYGDDVRPKDMLPMDEYDYGEYSEDEHKEYLKVMAVKICEIMNEHQVCHNGGTCALTKPLTERRPYQICSCPQGYGGLFCEKKPIPVPCDEEVVNCFVDPCQNATCPKYSTAECTSNYCGGCNAIFKLADGTDVTHECSDCRRDKLLSDTAREILMTVSPLSELLHKLMTAIPPKDYVLPMLTCDADGLYEPKQNWLLVPVTMGGVVIKTCVDPASGKRIKNTPIIFKDTQQMLDCSVKQTIDAQLLNPKCWLPTNEVCIDAAKCQWYYNGMNQKCEQGAAGYGFSTLNQCYDMCRAPAVKLCPPLPEGTFGTCAEMCPENGCPDGQKCCSNGCGHTCQTAISYEGALPCKDKMCDYKTEYCHVIQDDETGEHIGECKKFQEHCLEARDEGYGDRKFGAYYFNAAKRVCMRFVYKGMGGTRNRFYSLHQCQTECSTRTYEYSDPVCPAPKLLMMKNMKAPDMCDCDDDCKAHGMVCCSDGHARVCSLPVRSCLNGHRCSFYGFCDGDDMCQCPDCSDKTEVQKVCGYDGKTYKTYDNVCKLEMTSCKEKKKIVVKSQGECPSGQTSPTSEECMDNWVCSRQYMPLCVLARTGDGSIKTDTYTNPCEMAKDKMCNDKNLLVLYPGVCHRACYGSCPIYSTDCDDSGKCSCKMDCSMDHGGPVCGHRSDLPDKEMTFENVCELQKYGCEHTEIYTISKHGPCEGEKEIDELLECPKMDDNMLDMRPGIDEANCNPQDNEFCDAETEKCCSYGAGTHCIPKTKLVRPKKMAEGFCPMLSFITFQQKDCLPRKCEDDLDCKGQNGKCCPNFLCEHKTCASPIVKPKAPDVCGDGKFGLPHLVCNFDDGTGCPDKSTCTEVSRGSHKVHLCCAAESDKDLFTEDVIKDTKICQELAMMGVMCENNEKCKPNLQESRVCECSQGFYGALCELTEPTLDRQCPREKAIMRKLWEHMKDFVNRIKPYDMDDKEQKGDDNDSDEKNQETDNGDDDRNEMNKENDDKDMDDGDMEQWVDHELQEERLGMGLIRALMAKGVKYLLHDVQCDENGDFKHEQCAVLLEKRAKACFCIDKSNWLKHLPGPMARSLDDLDCSILTGGTDMPEFCPKRPVEGYCESLAGRYYFNPDTADCEEFKDMQCADDNGNNFDSYETCRSTCSSTSWTHKACWAVKCEAGTACRVKNGVAECKNVKEPKEMNKHFEPKCDKDGKFLPKQCSGNMCTCVRPDTGEVIENSLGSGERLMCKKDNTAPHGVKVERTGEPSTPG